jgi:hypothetical protein
MIPILSGGDKKMVYTFVVGKIIFFRESSIR